MKSKAYILIIALLLALAPQIFQGWVLAQESNTTIEADLNREELEARIDEQNQELEKLNQQLLETQAKLEGAKSERLSLQKELNTIKNSITQLNLSIKADEITVRKLELEVDSLSYDIRDIENSMIVKKQSIVEVLREIHRADTTNLLAIVLNGQSLADSILEAQALSDTGNQLGLDIDYLEKLREAKLSKIDEVNAKKIQINSRQINLANKRAIIEDKEVEKEALLAQSKNKESVYQSELDELRKKQDEIAETINQFEEELREKFNVGVLPSKRPGVFAWPVQLKNSGGVGIITQHFGEVSYLYRGKPHNGLDIGAPVGTPVTAADDGVVIAVDDNDRSAWRKYQYGKYVLIKHPNGLATLYAHLSRHAVKKGDEVKRGGLIGYVGSTGYSTGPHLHFGAYWASTISMKTVPPAAGLVPIGVVIAPEDYL